jgi:predicted MFS family arabinose efflux permease
MLAGRTGAALAALSAACFVSVTSENLPVAMLPQLAAGLHVSAAAVGLLVTGYAVVVALTVIPLVGLTAHWDRRTAILATTATIAGSNLLLALAPDYPVAVLARLVSAVGHGVFWSVVAPVAAGLLGPDRSGRATAVVFAGNSLAFLFGLPLSSWLGLTLGWRPTVLLVAAAAALAALVIRGTVGPIAPPPRTGAHWGRIAAGVAANRALLPVNLTTLVLVLGHFTVFTYITAVLTGYVHVSGSGVSAVLFAHGAVGLVSLVLVGRSVDAHPRSTVLVATAGLAACLLVLLLLGPSSPVVAGTAAVLWAVPGGAIAVVLQAGVLRVATAHQDLANACYIVAYQVGIALGALVGGLYLSAGALPVAVGTAAALALLAAGIAVRGPGFRAAARKPGLERRFQG